MTAAIMTRPALRTTGVATSPEYWCGSCNAFHAGPCAGTAHRQLGALLARMVREADARIPADRRVPRTAAEMRARLAERTAQAQAATMREDACPVCGLWSCDGTNCIAAAPAPTPAAAPATAGPGDPGWGQCSRCSGWFPGFPGGVCSACRTLV